MNSELLKSGLALVPIPVGLKGPRDDGWNLRNNAVIETKELKRLASMNVGLAHAYCTPTRTCAIDIDDYNQAYKWLLTHHIDLKALLLAEDAVVIWSGKRNSLKLLYRLPSKVGALPTKQFACDNESVMCEFRCASGSGKTVQDLLPPSQHPSGSTYRWMGSGDPLHIPPIPDRLLALWLRLIGNGSRKSSTRINHQQPETPRNVARLKKALTYINANCSYDKYIRVVWSILATGWRDAVDIAQDWSQTAPERFDDDCFDNLVRNYDSSRLDAVGVGTLFAYAGKGGFDG